VPYSADKAKAQVIGILTNASAALGVATLTAGSMLMGNVQQSGITGVEQ
jgi:hypothetical protein